MEMHDEYADLRAHFEIVAFHDGSAATFEELDAAMEPKIREAWDGRELPFPVLLDATRQTYRRYSVRALGTRTLIDPHGRVVRGDGKAVLRAALEALRLETLRLEALRREKG